ncbi:MAG: hypothetical protein AAGA43_12030 [Bacteroidota bacterium]
MIENTYAVVVDRYSLYFYGRRCDNKKDGNRQDLVHTLRDSEVLKKEQFSGIHPLFAISPINSPNNNRVIFFDKMNSLNQSLVDSNY